ncbi:MULTISPECIES: four helix bundle protein [unclassified Spirosoma]|uniref:four helix bundle protein n=1 Tax=unclassified Spirosoma TaxID=2621999 RepID=UPI000965957B|nr:MULTISPECIES: four helix bundle protein [unclassified Spirosoma]MBN8823348.1 four helix bundle protein [Spirosoma sp.]OJW72514.1 MAG: four helix bundle protein [Spirosoma sp. 48-14]
MAKIEQFEDLIVWKEGLRLAIDVYKSLAECKDFSLRDQMRRCSVSVPSNIAEGFERNSNKEFIRFLRISKGSSGELRTQLYIAIGVGLLDEESGKELINQSRLISRMLQSLIKTRLEKF